MNTNATNAQPAETNEMASPSMSAPNATANRSATAASPRRPRHRTRSAVVAAVLVATLGIAGAGTAYAAGADGTGTASGATVTPIEQIARGCQRIWSGACQWAGMSTSRGVCGRGADWGRSENGMMGSGAGRGATGIGYAQRSAIG